MKLPKPKKISISKLKKEKTWSSHKADIEFSKWIRERDKKCFFCYNMASQNSHFWGRSKSATRYEPDNCDGICGGCHMKHESNKQGLYREMKIKQLGQKRYNELRTIYYQSKMTRLEAIKYCMNLLGVLQ